MIPTVRVALGDALLVAVPGRRALAVFNGAGRQVLEGLIAGRDEPAIAADLAARWSLDPAAAHLAVADLRRGWRRLMRRLPPARTSDTIIGASAGPPRLDAVCRQQSGGTAVRVRIWPRRLAGLVAAVIEPCRVDPASDAASTLEVRMAGGCYRLVRDGQTTVTTRQLMVARSEVLRAILLACHPGRDWLAILHGAALSGPAGAALLCGASGAGKSTLVAHLLATGLDLLTDDYAPLEAATCGLWPVPFALSVKEGSWPLVAPLLPGLMAAPVLTTRGRRQRFVAPPRMATAPAMVRALLFPLYTPGAGCDCVALSPEEALALCAESGGWFETSPERVAALARWVEATPAYALSYGNTAAAVAQVRALLGLPA